MFFFQSGHRRVAGEEDRAGGRRPDRREGRREADRGQRGRRHRILQDQEVREGKAVLGGGCW